MRQGVYGIVDYEVASQNEVIPRDVGLVKYIGEFRGCGGGVDFWGMGLLELETEISRLGASNHGVSVGDVELNRLRAVGEMRRVEQCRAD